MTATTNPRAASTIILHRQAGSPEIYMLQRSSKASFMPNDLVFPGGALDDLDHDPRWLELADLNYASAKNRLHIDAGQHAHALMIAAIRETFEESGILLTTQHVRDFKTQHELRNALNAGKTSFLEVIKTLELELELSGLSFLSRWITPKVERKRFDAYFFMAKVPTGAFEASADGSETLAGRWITPESVLKAHRERTVQLAPPTLRAIQTLAHTTYSDWNSLQRSDSAAICPQLAPAQALPTLVLPGDPCYQPPGNTPNRFELNDTYWTSTGIGF